MEKSKENIDSIISKLKVLEDRIRKLESLTDGVLSEVNSVYKQQIKELQIKKELIKQKISDIQETGHNI